MRHFRALLSILIPVPKVKCLFALLALLCQSKGCTLLDKFLGSSARATNFRQHMLVAVLVAVLG